MRALLLQANLDLGFQLPLKSSKQEAVKVTENGLYVYAIPLNYLLCIFSVDAQLIFNSNFLVLQTEVNYLGQLHHENLVKLIGYCVESDNRLLVYEFMSKGSLENHLFRSKFFYLQIFHYYILLLA